MSTLTHIVQYVRVRISMIAMSMMNFLFSRSLEVIYSILLGFDQHYGRFIETSVRVTHKLSSIYRSIATGTRHFTSFMRQIRESLSWVSSVRRGWLRVVHLLLDDCVIIHRRGGVGWVHIQYHIWRTRCRGEGVPFLLIPTILSCRYMFEGRPLHLGNSCAPPMHKRVGNMWHNNCNQSNVTFIAGPFKQRANMNIRHITRSENEHTAYNN